MLWRKRARGRGQRSEIERKPADVYIHRTKAYKGPMCASLYIYCSMRACRWDRKCGLRHPTIVSSSAPACFFFFYIPSMIFSKRRVRWLSDCTGVSPVRILHGSCIYVPLMCYRRMMQTMGSRAALIGLECVGGAITKFRIERAREQSGRCARAKRNGGVFSDGRFILSSRWLGVKPPFAHVFRRLDSKTGFRCFRLKIMHIIDVFASKWFRI